jgi:hypothetical protein
VDYIRRRRGATDECRRALKMVRIGAVQHGTQSPNAHATPGPLRAAAPTPSTRRWQGIFFKLMY